MKIVGYYFQGVVLFLIGWIIIDGSIQITKVVISSGATIASFIFGGICFIIVGICLVILIDKINIALQQNKELDRKKRIAVDRMLDEYTSKIKNAKSQEEIDDAINYKESREMMLKNYYGG